MVDSEPVLFDVAGLYAAHRTAAVRFAQTIVRDPEMAAEVVQEAFISLWQMRDTVTAERGAARSLLLTLVHRRAVDALRVQSRRVPIVALNSDCSDAAADGDFGPEHRACSMEQVDIVMAAVASLPWLKQEVLLLAIRERTQLEIAGLLDVPVGTVKSRMLVAKRELRQALSCRPLELDGSVALVDRERGGPLRPAVRRRP